MNLTKIPQYLLYRAKFNLLPKIRRTIPSSFPTHVDIEVTNRCNLDCVHCGRSLMPDDVGLMDWRVFVTILSECIREGCPSIKLNWRGEPLIHPLLPEMVRMAKKMGILEVQLNTNAQMLTPKKTNQLCDAGLDRLIVSADGITKETYERIRQGASWEKLVENVKYFASRKNRPILRIQTCEIPQNSWEIGDFAEFWGEYADEIRVNQSFDPLKKKAVSYRRKEKKPCSQLWQRLVVSWTGNIHPCCVDWASQGVLGNIKEISLREAWNCLKERTLRSAHRNLVAGNLEPCKNCDNYFV